MPKRAEREFNSGVSKQQTTRAKTAFYSIINRLTPSWWEAHSTWKDHLFFSELAKLNLTTKPSRTVRRNIQYVLFGTLHFRHSTLNVTKEAIRGSLDGKSVLIVRRLEESNEVPIKSCRYNGMINGEMMRPRDAAKVFEKYYHALKGRNEREQALIAKQA